MSDIFRFAKGPGKVKRNVHRPIGPNPENVDDRLNFINFNDFKNMMNNFVHSKHWEQFYTPHNLYFALMGEVSELIDIFQWKNVNELHIENTIINENIRKMPFHSDIMNNQQYLSLTEYVHIGEELCDIFVYSTRLCHVFQIDVVYTINKILSHIHIDYSNIITQLYKPDEHTRSATWSELPFDSMYSQLEVHSEYINNESSKRRILHHLHQHLNEINAIMMLKNEFQCTPSRVLNEEAWGYSEISTITNSLAYIYINIFTMLICINDHAIVYTDKYKDERHVVLDCCSKRLSMSDVLQLKSIVHTPDA